MKRREFLGAIAAAAVARQLPAPLAGPVDAFEGVGTMYTSLECAPLPVRELWAVWMDPFGNIGVGRAAPADCVTLGVVETIGMTPNIAPSCSFHGDVRTFGDAIKGGAALSVADDVPQAALYPSRFVEGEIVEPLRGTGGPFGDVPVGWMVSRGRMPQPLDLGPPIRFNLDGVPSL